MELTAEELKKIFNQYYDQNMLKFITMNEQAQQLPIERNLAKAKRFDLVGTTYSEPFLCYPGIRGHIIANVHSISGTIPTCVIGIETSIDGKDWIHNTIIIDKDTQGDLTRLTAPTVEGKIQTTGVYNAWMDYLAKYIRYYVTLGGTLPVVSVTLNTMLYLT